MTTELTKIDGYVAGTWAIDPVHSEAAFVVRHLGVAKVRGRFDVLEGLIVTTENPMESTVNATIRTTSISTGNAQRDDHVRTEDFLNVEKHPEMTFASTGIRADGEDFILDGELTLRGVTKPISLQLELNGFGEGFEGKPLVGFSARTEISRADFAVSAGPANAIVSDKVVITLDIEANKQD